MKKKSIGILICVTVVLALMITFTGLYVNRRYYTRCLFDAIDSDDYDAVQTAIRHGAEVNGYKYVIYIPDVVMINPTPLVNACKKGNEDIVELLIDNGADINKTDKLTEETPLLAALHGVKQNRFSLAMYLIDLGADIHMKQDEVNSTFCETLIVSDFDTESTIEEGFQLFQYLIANDVDMELFMTRENVITFAAHYNNYNVVKYLIENDYFDVNDCDKEGNTALISAVKHDRPQIVKLLLELGADKYLKNFDKKSAIDYAQENQNESILRLLSE